MASLFSPEPPAPPPANVSLPVTDTTPKRFEQTQEQKDKQREESLKSQKENRSALASRNASRKASLLADASSYISLLSGE